MPALLSLLFFVFLQGNVLAQATRQKGSARQRFEQALLTRDLDLARKRLPQAKLTGWDLTLAKASALPPLERARAMIELAEAKDSGDHGITALVAGLTALLEHQGRARLLGWEEEDEDHAYAFDPKEFWSPRVETDDEGPKATPEIRKLLDMYAARITALREQVPSAKTRASLDEASWMLDTARIVRVQPGPMRVANGEGLAVPAPLAEEMRYSFYPWSMNRDCIWLHRDGKPKPTTHGKLGKSDYQRRVPTPPPGVYLLELTSPSTGWSRLRCVLVSDLELTTLVMAKHVIVMATMRGKPAADVELILRDDDEGDEMVRLTARTDKGGIAQFELENPLTRYDSELIASKDGHRAWQRLTQVKDGLQLPNRTESHVQCDRPLYRPGELVQGRVIGFHNRLGKTGVLKQEPLQDHPVRMTFTLPSSREIKLRGWTDAHGVFSFTFRIPLGSEGGGVECATHFSAAGYHRSYPFEIAAFRRATTLLRIDGPTEATTGIDGLSVQLKARYANGSPAAGLRVQVKGEFRGHKDSLDAVLDQAGKLTLPLAFRELRPAGAGRLDLSASLHSPEGKIIQAWHGIDLLGSEGKTNASETKHWAPDGHVILPRQHMRAGGKIPIRFEGKPHATHLFVAVRDRIVMARPLILDASGKASLELQTEARDWPSLHLLLVTHQSDNWRGSTASIDLGLARPAGPLTLSIQGLAKIYGPGQRVDFSVLARDSAGKPAKATVCVAVVDERIFDATRRRQHRAGLALRPWLRQPRARPQLPREFDDAWEIFGTMLTSGWVNLPSGLPFRWNSWRTHPVGGSPSTPGMTGSAGSLDVIRKDFRPTAFFVPTVVTDSQGRANVSFTLPDQLTTWRCTIVAVTPTALARTEKVWFDTRKDGAAELILPRLLRKGDSIRSPLLHDKGVTVEATATGALRIASKDTKALPSLRLQAFQAGPAKLQLEARLAGKVSDRSEYSLDVLPNTVSRTTSRSFAVSKRTRLQEQQVASAQQRLIVYANRQALLRHASEFLTDYPHGCVEQICSRMLPLFLGHRLDTLLDRPAADQRNADRERKIQEGFALLRRRLVSPTRGFRWWTEAEVDARMSALGITTLTVARQGGIDPADWNLALQPGKGELLELAQTLVEQKGVLAVAVDPSPTEAHADEDASETKKRQVGLAEAELIVACLRYQPDLPTHKAAARALLSAQQDLPPGLLARAGLALHAAGETALAREALTRILEGRRVQSDARSSFPGESQVSRLAQELELLIRVDPANAARAGIVTRLLALSRDGRFGETYGTACALTALLLDLEGQAPIASAVDREITVWTDGKAQRHVLRQDRRRPLALDIQGKLIELDPGDGSPLHVLLETTTQDPASNHQGWKDPLVVQRFLRRSSNGFVDDKGLTEIGTAATTRDVLEVEIRVQSPERLEYLSLACPIPAGWEVAEKGDFGILHDDEAIAAIPVLQAGKVHSYSMVLRSAMAGEVSWPPARAACMYQPGLSGASKGRRIVVKLAGSLPATTNITALFSKGSPNYHPPEIEIEKPEPVPSAVLQVWRAWCALAEQSCFDAYIRNEKSATVPQGLRKSAAELARLIDGILAKKDLAGSIRDLATILEDSADFVAVDELESGGSPGVSAHFVGESRARIADKLLPKLAKESQVWTTESEALLEALVAWSEEPVARRGILALGRAAAQSRDIRDMEKYIGGIFGLEPWPQLSQFLWDCCSSPRKDFRQAALGALQGSQWKQLGEADLRLLTGEYLWGDEVEFLAACGDTGEKILLEALARHRISDPEEMARTLGPSFANRLPLPLLMSLEDDGLILHLLSHPRLTDQTLAHRLRMLLGMEEKALLFRALMARGVTRLTFDAKDAFAPWLTLAAASWHGDEKAAARIFTEGLEISFPHELDWLLARSLMPHYRADNFSGWGGMLENADARICLARFGPEEIRKLVLEESFDSYTLLPPTALEPLARELLASVLTSIEAGDELLPLFARSAPLKARLETCLREHCSPGTGARIAEQFYELTGFPLQYRGSTGALHRFEASDPQHRDEAFYRRARSPLPDLTSEPRASLLRHRVGLH